MAKQLAKNTFFPDKGREIFPRLCVDGKKLLLLQCGMGIVYF